MDAKELQHTYYWVMLLFRNADSKQEVTYVPRKCPTPMPTAPKRKTRASVVSTLLRLVFGLCLYERFTSPAVIGRSPRLELDKSSSATPEMSLSHLSSTSDCTESLSVRAHSERVSSVAVCNNFNIAHTGKYNSHLE